ncbi:hypothetical protein M153_4440001487 [Pseudoloma neurophilia]|uniref:Uncharacterized protein n=1 Tax=Pseudoloma neurophilia TaxID=146866 RepID=A0A0R0LXE6_9MICR|nr:hypothetical protein M153_4440001487 [Pseudoloma neurophilia]
MFDIFSLFSKKKKTYGKLPKIVFIISSYDDISQETLFFLKKKYNIAQITSLEQNEAGKFFYNGHLDIKDVPDLIILCHDKLEFHLEQPEILYKAEIVHSRCCFSESVFENALSHFSDALINNGK